MKIQMKDILALCFLAMLFVGIVGGIKCLGCTDVRHDNSCKRKAYECNAGKRRSCYTRKFSKSRKIVKIQRGCISFCKSETQIKWGLSRTTWCCQRERCNSLNVWY